MEDDFPLETFAANLPQTMQLLILHLSDIHFQGPRDRILKRIKEIAATADPLIHHADGVFVVATGDIANTGATVEYEVAGGFLADLRAELTARLPTTPIYTFTVPGNHDCDFSSPQSTRDIVIAELLKNPSDCSNPDLQRTCAGPQVNYFRFHQTVLGAPAFDASPLYKRLIVSVGNSSICVDLFNTAWMSQKHEKPGHLLWPHDLRPEAVKCDLAVAFLHHPLGWHSPESQRHLQEILVANSDVVLTGHEHTPGNQKTTFSEQSDLSLIQGAALQTPDFPGDCGFNVVAIDTDTRLYSVFEYHWKSAGFKPRDKHPVPTSFRDRASVRDVAFRITDGFVRHLADAGASFSHPRKDTVTLMMFL